LLLSHSPFPHSPFPRRGNGEWGKWGKEGNNKKAQRRSVDLKIKVSKYFYQKSGLGYILFNLII